VFFPRASLQRNNAAFLRGQPTSCNRHSAVKW
jgi:hypothetical protein